MRLSIHLPQYPAEFIKTRRQLPQYTNGTASSFAILKSTYSTTGISGFYSGCRALVVSNACKSGIRFLSFEASKDYLDKLVGTATGNHKLWVTMLSGLNAGVIESILVVTPGEALKTKIIHDASLGNGRFAKRGLMWTANQTVRKDGPLALWKGLGPVLCKQGTNSAVRFTTFGMMQEQVAKAWPGLEGNTGSTLVLGAISGFVTVSVLFRSQS
jgi:solute carrier family 25 citrate transporter 1